jgi:hypothetical protein
MAFILIQRGSLGVELTPTSFRKGPDIDLNVKALPEEEPSIATSKDLGFDLNLAPAEEQLSFAPSDSATSLTASTVLASVEKQDLTGHKTKPLAVTSTGITLPSWVTTSANKRKRISRVFHGEKKDRNPSKQQLGTRKRMRENLRANNLQEGGVEKAPRMKKLKDAMVTRQHKKYRTQPKSSRPGSPSEASPFFQTGTMSK